jgi:hypothetical protein
LLLVVIANAISPAIIVAISPVIIVAITDISIQSSPPPPNTLRCTSTLALAFLFYRLIFAFSIDVLPDYDIGDPVILEPRQVRLDIPGLNALVNHLHLLEYTLTARAIFPIFVND